MPDFFITHVGTIHSDMDCQGVKHALNTPPTHGWCGAVVTVRSNDDLMAQVRHGKRLMMDIHDWPVLRCCTRRICNQGVTRISYEVLS